MATRIRRRGAGPAHQAVDSGSLEWHDACQPCRQQGEQRLRCRPARLCSQPMGSGDYPTPWIHGNDQQWALLESNADASPLGFIPPRPRHDLCRQMRAAVTWWKEKRRCDGMEMRGRSGVVEKMENEAMNCLAQGNKWKLALGRGGGRRRFTVQGVEIIFYLRRGPLLQQASCPPVQSMQSPYKACVRGSKISLTSIFL
jgi:hypothetical protein